MRTPFLGGTYISRSSNLADNRAVNIYPEVVETKEGKDVGAFYGCPGLDPLASISAQPVRGQGMIQIGNNLYVVCGNTIYQIGLDFSFTALGNIGTMSGPISIVASDTQVLVVDATGGYVVTISTGGVALATGFPVGGSIAAYQDGFALVTVVNTNEFFQSNLNDLSTWNALNFSSADGQAGFVQSIASLNREMWIFCDNNTEIWVNAGLSGFAFQRLQGVFIEVGCSAPFSVARNVDQSVMWIGKTENGGSVCYRSQGYVPQRVSTHSVERIWATYPTVADAVAYSYLQEGHTFYVVSFPSGDATWCYDTTTGYWHERAAFSNGSFHRHVGIAQASFKGKNVIGDYSTGNLYALDLDTYSDNGADRKWLRSWRALQKKSEKQMAFERLTIDCQTGIAVPPSALPIASLRWSDDGGHLWSNYRQRKFGEIGQTHRQVVFRRMGMTRRKTGLDRVYELSGVGQYPVAMIGADLEASEA